MSDNCRKFIRAERRKYSLKEKNLLRELVRKYKEEHDKQVEISATQINYNEETYKKAPREGFFTQAIREFYDDLKDVEHDEPKFIAAVKLGKRRDQNLLERGEAEKIMEPTCSKSKYRKEEAGRKVMIHNVCEALFEWFVYVWGTLKARLPIKMLKAQYKILYDQSLPQEPSEIPDDKKNSFFLLMDKKLDEKVWGKLAAPKQTLSNKTNR